jgi:hypothetical protein
MRGFAETLQRHTTLDTTFFRNGHRHFAMGTGTPDPYRQYLKEFFKYQEEVLLSRSGKAQELQTLLSPHRPILQTDMTVDKKKVWQLGPLTGSVCSVCNDGILLSDLGARLHHLEVHNEGPKQKKQRKD